MLKVKFIDEFEPHESHYFLAEYLTDLYLANDRCRPLKEFPIQKGRNINKFSITSYIMYRWL